MILYYHLLAGVLLNCIFASFAYAYVDPNTGGFFFQTVAPFVYGILGAIVIFWKRIAGFVKGILSRKKGENSSIKNE